MGTIESPMANRSNEYRFTFLPLDIYYDRHWSYQTQYPIYWNGDGIVDGKVDHNK